MENPRMRQTRCSKCGRVVPGYDILTSGSVETGYRAICTRCYNNEAAESDGLKFEHADFAPIEIADCDGEAHHFHFRTRLFGPGVALDAFEIQDGYPAGHQFQSDQEFDVHSRICLC